MIKDNEDVFLHILPPTSIWLYIIQCSPTLVKSSLPYSRPVLEQLHMAGEGLNHADCSRFKFLISKLKWTLGAT